MNGSEGSVILVSGETAMAEAVESALGGHDLRLGEICRDITQLARRLAAVEAHAVLVDLGHNPPKTLGELAQVTERYPDVRFIVLANEVNNELIFDAMAVGARYFLLKASVPTELRGILTRLAANAAAVSPHAAGAGKMVTVLSAGGGCGATTVAINLANELKLETSRPVLLVDLDVAYGAVGVYLELEYSFGLTDVLNYEGAIDGDLVRSSATPYSGDMHVLMSSVGSARGHGKPLRWENLQKLVVASRSAYPYTVLDAPRLGIDAAAELALASTMTILVFQLNVKDIRIAKAQIEALAERGVSSSRIVPLANRYRKRNPMVSLEQGAAALGAGKLDWVSNDFRSAVRAMNYGQPLSMIAPRSTLRQDVRRLAMRVCVDGDAGAKGG